ncbi:hypothetical protein ABFS83_08G031700 [Erythranthe nasuta]
MFSAMCVCVLVLIDMLIYIHGKGLKAAAFTDEVTLGNARASLSLSSENIRNLFFWLEQTPLQKTSRSGSTSQEKTEKGLIFLLAIKTNRVYT